MDGDLLVVEPDGEVAGRWRFGRVADRDDAFGEDTGVIEERDGGFHLLSRHADALAALQLVRSHQGPPRRLVGDRRAPVALAGAGASRTVAPLAGIGEGPHRAAAPAPSSAPSPSAGSVGDGRAPATNA